MDEPFYNMVVAKTKIRWEINRTGYELCPIALLHF
jgi:hypothetical protein